MKKRLLQIKSIGIAITMLLFVFFTLTTVKAFDAVDEAKKIGSNVNNIYTVYIGMPEANLVENFKGVKGWKASHNRFDYVWDRKYSGWGEVKAGASLNQRIIYIVGNEHIVRRMHVVFLTDSFRYVKEIYAAMYKNMESTYGPPQRISENSDLSFRVATWENQHYVYQLMQNATAENYGVLNQKPKGYYVQLGVYPYDGFPRFDD